ncbi:hypothetical protein J6590_038734 [Homalodisca vitripennis]|nr:hypothetical protein J6590_038734 [Homalodisca vitripennis]
MFLYQVEHHSQGPVEERLESLDKRSGLPCTYEQSNSRGIQIGLLYIPIVSLQRVWCNGNGAVVRLAEIVKVTPVSGRVLIMW